MPSIPFDNSELTYQVCAIWSFLQTSINALSINNYGCRSLPREEPLISMTKQLKYTGQHDDERNCYKADSVFPLKDLFNLEILLLETSEAFASINKSKQSFDHHKEMFGFLCMLKTIADEFNYAAIKSFEKVKVFMLCAAGKIITLWSMRYKDGIYDMWQEAKLVEFKPDFSSKETFLVDLV